MRWFEARGRELPRVIAGLLAGIKDEDKKIRRESAATLGRLRDGREAVILVGLLSGLEDGHEDVRCASAKALGRLGDRCGDKNRRLSASSRIYFIFWI